MLKRTVTGILPMLLLPALPAQAHVLAGTGAGLAAGILHPLSGLDHLVALFAIGLWWGHALPGHVRLLAASCALALSAGMLAGLNGLALPMAETGIALSVLVPGLLLATRLHLPLAVGMPVFGWFALNHGYVHGLEAPVSAGAAYGLGLIGTSMVLLGLGTAAGMYRAGRRPVVLRLAGAVLAGVGVWLIGGLAA